MSTGINFAPGSHEHSKHGKSGGIEYSSGEGDEPKPIAEKPAEPERPTPGPVPEKQPEEKKPDEPKQKKPHAFFSWRKKQHPESVPSVEQKKPEEPLISLAPHHQIERVRTDLLHGSTFTAQKPVAAPAETPRIEPAQPIVAPVQTPTPAQIPTPAAAPVVPPVPQEQPKPVRKLTRKEQKQRLVDELPVTEVNLIPDVALTEREKRNALRDLGYLVLILTAVVLLVYGGLKMYERKITSDTLVVESDIQSLNGQIATYESTQGLAQDLSDHLTALDRVMQAHVYWTPFLQTVEDLTLPTVYYVSMTGSATSLSFTFDAVAESYSQVAPQVEIFRQSPFVKNVTISAVQSFEASSVISASPTTPESAGGVSFKMTVDFTPDIFIHPQLRSYAQN